MLSLQMYLPAKALDIVNITTAKSSEVNVAVSGLADDLVEMPTGSKKNFAE